MKKFCYSLVFAYHKHVLSVLSMYFLYPGYCSRPGWPIGYVSPLMKAISSDGLCEKLSWMMHHWNESVVRVLLLKVNSECLGVKAVVNLLKICYII